MSDTVFSPRSSARLLDEAMDRAKRGPHRLILGLSACVALVSMVYTAFTVSATMAIPAADFGAFSFVGMLVMMPILLFAQFIGYALLAILATNRIAGREASLRTALGQLFSLRVFFALVLAGVLVTFSLLLLIVPGLVVAALFSFIVPALILEDQPLLDSLTRSSSLAWSNPKGRLRSSPLLVIMSGHTVFFVLTSGLTLALSLPVQIALQYFTLRDLVGGGDETGAAAAAIAAWLQIPVAGLGVVVTFYCFYYLCLFLGLYFFEVREAREAPSLEASVVGWGSIDEPAAP